MAFGAKNFFADFNTGPPIPMGNAGSPDIFQSKMLELMESLEYVLGATNARRRAGRAGAEGQLEGWMCV